MSKRQNQQREKELQPERIEYAIEVLEGEGFEIDLRDETKIQFEYKNETVTLFPYSGWHTGKSIKDGRGLSNLIKQLR